MRQRKLSTGWKTCRIFWQDVCSERMVRINAFGVPNSAPIPALKWDTFFLSIEHFINQKKLIFMHYSATLDETSLANQICAIRKELKFPCFIPETKKLLHFYGLPDVSEKPFETKKKRWAGLVKSAERNTSVFNTFFLLNLGAKFCL